MSEDNRGWVASIVLRHRHVHRLRCLRCPIGRWFQLGQRRNLFSSGLHCTEDGLLLRVVLVGLATDARIVFTFYGSFRYPPLLRPATTCT